MLEALRNEVREAHSTLEDMWLDLSLDHDHISNLQDVYNCAESLLDSGDLDAAQERLHQFWNSLGGCQ